MIVAEAPVTAAATAETPQEPTTQTPAKSKALRAKKPTVAKTAVKKAEKQVKKTPSPAKTSGKAAHPKYHVMVKDALATLKERGGVSRQAILRYIIEHYSLPYEAKAINQHLGMTLRAGVKNGSLKQSKGSGACGSFKLGETKLTIKSKPKPESKKATPKPAKQAAKKTSEKTKKSKTAKSGKTEKAKASPVKSKAKSSPVKSKAKSTPVKSKSKSTSSKKVMKKPGKPKSLKKAAVTA